MLPSQGCWRLCPRNSFSFYDVLDTGVLLLTVFLPGSIKLKSGKKACHFEDGQTVARVMLMSRLREVCVRLRRRRAGLTSRKLSR